MVLEINREGIEKHLGEQVEVLQGVKHALGIGVIAYEHNTDRLSIYSPDGKQLKTFLRGNEVIQFLKDPNEVYRIPKNINRPTGSN